MFSKANSELVIAYSRIIDNGTFRRLRKCSEGLFESTVPEVSYKGQIC
jgi:hypothetical protein